MPDVPQLDCVGDTVGEDYNHNCCVKCGVREPRSKGSSSYAIAPIYHMTVTALVRGFDFFVRASIKASRSHETAAVFPTCRTCRHKSNSWSNYSDCESTLMFVRELQLTLHCSQEGRDLRELGWLRYGDHSFRLPPILVTLIAADPQRSCCTIVLLRRKTS